MNRGNGAPLFRAKTIGDGRFLRVLREFEIDVHRLCRPLITRPLVLERKGIDLVRFREVGIFGEPALKLGKARFVVRIKIAVGQRMADQDRVFDLLDHGIGARPLRLIIDAENLGITQHIVRAQHRAVADEV